MTYNTLTQEETDIIVHRGTEPPGSGRYDHFYDEGTYICRRCNAPLYSSKTKFDAGCGWPSFDENFPDAVMRLADPDGKRVEIRCANCDAHIGHVFTGEGMTDKNTRHCVNSLSIRFIPNGTSIPEKRAP